MPQSLGPHRDYHAQLPASVRIQQYEHGGAPLHGQGIPDGEGGGFERRETLERGLWRDGGRQRRSGQREGERSEGRFK